MSETLDPLHLPLRGSRLIEASAGTGKTWTIAALYLRLALGHGCVPRVPSEILVMTFTKAATRELSDRIRRRLVEAADCFRGHPASPDDPFMSRLLAEFPSAPAREQAAWRLSAAAEAMDDAAVHTIDAWCQRMLREHAFDTGCLFDEELQAHEASLRAEAVRDYWRQQVYPLDDEALAGVLAQWPDVEALAQDLKDLVDKPLPAAADAPGSLQEAAARAAQLRAERLAELKRGWDARADEMLAWLDPIWKDRQHPARPAMPRESDGRRWIAALRSWALDPAQEQPDLKSGADRLTRKALRAGLGENGASLELPDCFAAFEALMTGLSALPAADPARRLHAALHVQARVQQLKARAGTFGFADMLNRLDAALDPSLRGAAAARLRQRILARCPAALVDEFQDTSPVQLRIFDRLYRIADDDPSRTLLLIGDPKQAIYGFRGADIGSYLKARQATEGRHHALGTNHRSTHALVHVVNCLFSAAEARADEGAFPYGTSGKASALPFVPVQARGRPERLVAGGQEVPALTLVLDEPLRNQEGGRLLFSALCAERIVTLLNDPQVGFEEVGEPFRRLRPADIAVLVRSRTEADVVRHEMRRRGLASVYLSDQDMVWQTPEAADLLRLLQAVAAPRNVRLVRAALASTLIGRTMPELVALAGDDRLFDQHCEQMQQLHQTWKSQGVLAMVRRALHAFDLPARWLASDDREPLGERRLTNVLQLAELLQAASVQAEGEQSLLRWLAQQIADAAEGLNHSDDAVLRLESDADLVKVVTVHKSKGLEYPLVFLPFAAHVLAGAASGAGASDALRLLPGASAADSATPGREGLLSSRADPPVEAEMERRHEEARLLYVALTRARHALWVGLAGLQLGTGKVYAWHHSGIGRLLSGPAEQPPPQRIADVLAFAGATRGVVVEPVPRDIEPSRLPVTALHGLAALPALAQAADYTATFDRQWAISSYTTLVRDAAWGADGSGSDPGRRVRDDEPGDPDGLAVPDRPDRLGDQAWHRFPRGAAAGTFLHDQLEWLATERFALDVSQDLQRTLLGRCERQGWGHRAEEVLTWLRRVCTRSLPVLGVPLATLTTLAPEMEFWFPSNGLQAGLIDALCRQHLLPDRPRPALPDRVLEGMVMGFADLVFEHAGRWWVLDYKSNALGARDADYTLDAMQAAMLEHRYDVQAALYLLALHRLLRSRLGAAYAPERHLGGAICFFLRGVQGAAAGCCHLSPALGLLDALDAMSASAGRAPKGQLA